MAKKSIWSGAELQRQLEQKTGLRISASGISRLMNEEQSEIKLRVLDALCCVLECQPDELIIRNTVVNAVDDKQIDSAKN